MRVSGSPPQGVLPRMRLIKFAGSLVEAQLWLLSAVGAELWGLEAFVSALTVILLSRESLRALYLLIQLFGSLLDCRSDAVKPMGLL